MWRTWPVAGLAAALIVCGVAPLAAQPPIDRSWPSAPRERGGVGTGLTVSPFFEGWYENPDGSYTLSFGFFNRNTEEVLHIPQGPANFIEPAEYDGRQPTLFAPRRDTGIFTVTIPGDYARDDGRVVWTLHTPGHDEPHSVPGRAGVEAYRLHYIPMAMGSLPPMLKLQEDGPELWGPMTLAGDAREASTWASGQNPPGSVTNPLRMTATVGTPLALTVPGCRPDRPGCGARASRRGRPVVHAPRAGACHLRRTAARAGCRWQSHDERDVQRAWRLPGPGPRGQLQSGRQHHRRSVLLDERLRRRHGFAVGQANSQVPPVT